MADLEGTHTANDTKHNEYQNNNEKLQEITKVLKMQNHFRQCNMMCDVILLTDDGVKIPAHKVILASSSLFFLTMFNTNFKEKNDKIIAIQDIDSNILEIVIKYMYTFELDMTEYNIESILKSVHFFGLDRSIDICCDFIKSILSSNNCLNFMKYAELFSYRKLYDLCFSYALEHLFDIEDYILYDLSFEEIRRFISNDLLVSQSEERVFKFVLDWIKFDEENRKEHLIELMKYVRLSLVQKQFLVDVLKDTLIRVDTIMESIIMNLIDSEYHTKINKFNHKGKNRFPTSLKNPNVIVTIDNHSLDEKVRYIEIVDGISDCIIGSKFLIPPKKYSKIVSYSNYLLSIGGKYPGSNIAINNVYFLDLLQEPYIWVPTTPMISCRKDFTVCVNEKRIFAVGGIDENEDTLDTIEFFDIDSHKWTLLCKMMVSRSNCCAVYHNEFLYVVGGRIKDYTINYDADTLVECFNDSLSIWDNYIDPLPQWCTEVTCVTVVQNILYIIGHCDELRETNNLNTIYKYKLSKNSKWSLITLLETRDHISSVVEINNQMFILGRDLLDNIEVYDPNTKTFTIYDLYYLEINEFHFKWTNVITLNKKILDLLNLKI